MDKVGDILMLCESIQEPSELASLDRSKWKANIKYDGERVGIVKKGSEVMLFNRRSNILNYKFNEVVEAVKKIPFDFLIDTEIINIDNSVGGNFNLLSRRALTKDKSKIALLEKEIPVKAIVFDIISFSGKSYMNEPLSYRMEVLNDLMKFNTSESLEVVKFEEIDSCLKRVVEGEGEGIVIKKMDSCYESRRSKSWCKHKLFHETTITITGFTENPAGIRATDNQDNAVQISGNQSTEVKQILQSVGYASINVQYLTKSKEGRMRFPSFRGLVK